MNWIFRLLVIVIILPLSAFSCDTNVGANCHQHIDITNASSKEIIVIIIDYYESIDKPLDSYTLSLLVYQNLKEGANIGYSISPGQTKRVVDMLNSTMCIESYLKHIDCWIFFILDAEIVTNSTAEELSDGRAVLDKIYYSCDDIALLGMDLVYR